MMGTHKCNKPVEGHRFGSSRISQMMRPIRYMLAWKKQARGFSSLHLIERLKEFEWNVDNKGIEAASTPPSSWYTNNDWYRLVENTQTFPNGWLLAGRRNQLVDDGDFLAGSVANYPWVVVQHEGKTNGFYNVCRHHAAQIVDEGVGNIGPSKRFRCPYHGWQYNTDGRLALASQMKGCLDFKAKDNGLHPILVDVVGPWIFIRLNTKSSTGTLLGDQPDMETFFKLLEETNYSNLVHVAHKAYKIDCNYKVYIDNYLDGGYHVPVAHPGLASSLDMSAYRREGFDNFFVQRCGAAQAKNSSSGGNSESTHGEVGNAHIKEQQRVTAGDHDALYLYQYPNLCVNRYGKWMDTNVVLPDGPNACIGKKLSLFVLPPFLVPEADCCRQSFLIGMCPPNWLVTRPMWTGAS